MATKAAASDNEKQIQSKRFSGVTLGSNLILEKIVSHKVALMELFDALFGHNGYSGIAFQ